MAGRADHAGPGAAPVARLAQRLFQVLAKQPQHRQRGADAIGADIAHHIGDARHESRQRRVPCRPAGRADRDELAARIVPIGPDMDMPGPFQTRQRVGHRTTGDVKCLGKLGRAAFDIQMREQVQHRKMRNLHALGQRLANQVTRQLVRDEHLGKQACRQGIGRCLGRNLQRILRLVFHGPANFRSWVRDGMRDRALTMASGSSSTKVTPGSVPPSART